MSLPFKDTLKRAKSIPLNMGGPYQLGLEYEVLDKVAENAVLKSTFAILVGMVYDFELPNSGSSATRLLDMLRSNCHQSYKILRAFEAARSILIRSNPNIDTYRDLKHRFIDMLDGEMGTVAVMATVAPLINDWLVNRKITSFAQCLQFFTFPGHLNVDGCLTYLREGVDELEAFENLLKDHSGEQEYTTREGELISEWFPKEKLDLLLRYYTPTHGKGATAEISRQGASLREKYRVQESTLTAFDLWVSQHLERYAETNIRHTSGHKRREDFNRLYFGVISEIWPELGEKKKKKRKHLPPATGTMVPKSWKKGRGITKEATHLAFQQAGCRKAIRRFIRSELSNILLPHYTINDDEPNRELAKLGSFEGDFATIDLSSASDSITLKMVEQWTKNSCLQQLLLKTRSENIQLVWPEIDTRKNGEQYISYSPEHCESKVIPAYKYAGMGNGTTFTVESIIFCAIVWSAIESLGYDPSVIRWLVWGDDIIVPLKCAKAVIERLELNGFKVNKDKSFYEAPDYLGFVDGKELWNCYRESCGGEYLAGSDVTPIRVPRTFIGFASMGAQHTPESLATTLDLFNKFDSLQYPVVRRMLWNEICLHFVKLSDTRVSYTEKTTPILKVEGPRELGKTKSPNALKPKKYLLSKDEKVIGSKYWMPPFCEMDSPDAMSIKSWSTWDSNPSVRINGHNYRVGGTLVARYDFEPANGHVPRSVRDKYAELCRLNKPATDDCRVRLFEDAVHRVDKDFKDAAYFTYYESIHSLVRKNDPIAELDEDLEPQSLKATLDKWLSLQNAVEVRLNKPSQITWEPRVRC